MKSNILLKNIDYEFWFITGSQYLYGEDILDQIKNESEIIVDELNKSDIFFKIKFIDVVLTSESIKEKILQSNSDKKCLGLIFWMHTFSPSKMWINGLSEISKPFLHLHTQFNSEIPWAEIDMNFMNLHQSAHGDREFGHLCSKLNLKRKVITGHWKDTMVHHEIDTWMRACLGLHEMKTLKVARFGDNMRDVSSTEGDKVDFQKKFGVSVNSYGISELVNECNSINEYEIHSLVDIYLNEYTYKETFRDSKDKMISLFEAARIELGLKSFLKKNGFAAFTTTFEDLNGLDQLPGIAVQRLMKQGYGFGAEGDWKTAALVRACKIMAIGKEEGTSFMEDYTYHFNEETDYVLGAHMLEVCESIANKKPELKVEKLDIGGKNPPARLVFNAKPGKAVNASLVDLGNRFRLIVNSVVSKKIEKEIPKLPVARALWEPMKNLKTSATAWILAGGSHHTVFSLAIDKNVLLDFSLVSNIECIVVDDVNDITSFQQQLELNNLIYS